MLIPLRKKKPIPREPQQLDPQGLRLGKVIHLGYEDFAESLGTRDHDSLDISSHVVPDEPIVGDFFRP